MSASVALAVKVSVEAKATFLSPIAASTGATFTSATVTVISRESDKAGVPLSVTTTVEQYLPVPCASVGVHEKAPDELSIDAPVGFVVVPPIQVPVPFASE